jgi:hypothetical protein
MGVGCTVALVVLVVVMLLGVRACTLGSPEDQAKELAEMQERRRAVEAENASEAKRMGVSIEDYMQAKATSGTAYAECKVVAQSRAKRNYKSDFFPKYDWELKQNIISITGRDLRMQNGFGVYEPVIYWCDWSMASRSVKSMLVAEQ